MLLLDFGSCRARTGQKTLLENIMKCCPTARYSNVPQHHKLISSPKNPKVPNSIRYHITDIYIDELDKLQPLDSIDESFSSVIQLLTKPFVKLRDENRDKVTRAKAKELVDDPRLQITDDK